MSDPAVVTPAADAAVVPTTVPATPTPPAAATAEVEPWRNPAEIKKMMISHRALEAKVAELETKTPAATAESKTNDKVDAGAQALSLVQELKRDLDMERAFGALKVEPGSKQRQLLELAVKAAAPPNVHEFLQQFVDPAVTPVAAAVKTPVTNSGAPASAGAGEGAPPSPAALTPAMIAGMSKDQLLAHYQGYVQSKSPNANPFASRAAPKKE